MWRDFLLTSLCAARDSGFTFFTFLLLFLQLTHSCHPLLVVCVLHYPLFHQPVLFISYAQGIFWPIWSTSCFGENSAWKWSLGWTDKQARVLCWQGGKDSQFLSHPYTYPLIGIYAHMLWCSPAHIQVSEKAPLKFTKYKIHQEMKKIIIGSSRGSSSSHSTNMYWGPPVYQALSGSQSRTDSLPWDLK